MKKTIALAALMLLTLTGCVMQPAPVGATPGEARPAAQEQIEEITGETHEAPEPVAAGYPMTAAETAFFDAIAGGFVQPDLPRVTEAILGDDELITSTLYAGRSICPVLEIDRDSGFIIAVDTAGDMLSDPSVFEPTMPLLFVTAAEEHLC